MTSPLWRILLDQAWAGVSGGTPAPVRLDLVGPPPRGALRSALPVADTAIACVGSALLAAAALADRPAAVGLAAEQVAAAVRSERYLRVDGTSPGPGFAPLSRFWPTAAGWIRTHANYPWHRRALLAALGLDEPDVDRVAAVLAELGAEEAERRIVAGGGVAAALRTPEQWLAHPQGQAVAAQPLIADAHFPGRPVRWARRPGAPPAAGARVLDLTRVIAGPVATRYLAALGAEVLRLDPPDLPELPVHRYDGLLGKRSALLDAHTPAGSARLHELLDGADVLVHGYRPGALARFGLTAERLAERHPGLVVVSLSAWGRHGPWGDRRGFDSIVQVATGIAVRESTGDAPGTLPCQLLDHGTGYLCAAAALDGLRRRDRAGGTWVRELSLARTAHWLLGQPTEPAGGPAAAGADPQRWATLPSAAGPVRTVPPPGTWDGTPLRWPDLPVRYGLDPPAWRPETSGNGRAGHDQAADGYSTSP